MLVQYSIFRFATTTSRKCFTRSKEIKVTDRKEENELRINAIKERGKDFLARGKYRKGMGWKKREGMPEVRNRGHWTLDSLRDLQKQAMLLKLIQVGYRTSHLFPIPAPLSPSEAPCLARFVPISLFTSLLSVVTSRRL